MSVIVTFTGASSPAGHTRQLDIVSRLLGFVVPTSGWLDWFDVGDIDL